MNQPKFTADADINFLIATHKVDSCVEAERVQPQKGNAPAHDAITRLLHRMEPSPEELWQEAESHVNQETGILVIADSTLDKLYTEKIELG